ncbi:lantibiotic dehydratase [Nocardiopsis oceani]
MTGNTGTVPTTTRRGPREHWTSTDVFMLRVGGLPWDAVRPLGCTATTDWAAGILAREHYLRERATALGDTIEPLVTEYDGNVRRALLSLRRDAHNLRMPRSRARLDKALERLPEALQEEIVDWISQRQALERELANGDEVLAHELERQRTHVHGLADDPRLRHGLLLASPSLERYLPTYLDADPRRLPKQARKVERSLLEYVFRTACKTSPFSTLTTVAAGTFADTGQILESGSRNLVVRSHVRVNMGTLGRLAAAVGQDWERLADLPVAVSSGHSLDRDRVRYVRRTKSTGDGEDPVLLESLREELFFVSHSGLLGEIIEILDQNPGTRLGALAERLADQRERDPGELRAYLRSLLRLSLLTLPTLDIDIHSPDPLRTFRDGMAGLDRAWADRVVVGLDRVAELVAAYPGAGTDRRRDLRDAVHEALGQTLEFLDPEAAPMPQGVLYEDVSLPEIGVRANRNRWDETILNDLRGLTGILPLFDMMLPHRLVLLGFFRARFGENGTCDDVLKFVHEFHLDIYDQFLQASSQRTPFDEQGEYVPLDNWLRMSEMTALDTARVELVRRMRLAHAELPGPDADLVLDDEFMEAVADLLPLPVHQLDSRSFFLQVGRAPRGEQTAGGQARPQPPEEDGPESGEERPLAVVNRSYSGLTLLYSRFLHCFEQTGEPAVLDELRRTLLEVCPDGAVLAELTGGYDNTNLNLHPTVTEYEIVCPGEVSSRPEQECVRVEELQIRHSDETGLYLYCPRIERTVIPVYLGFLLPLALPEVQRALLLFTPTAMAPLDLWQGTRTLATDTDVTSRPRVRYRGLVLSRRAWQTSSGRMPVRTSEQSDADWFLAWRRWHTAQGLPERVFVSVDRPEPGADDAPETATQSTKPQYVDFTSFFSLQLLERMVSGPDRQVVLTEMEPGPDELWLRGADGTHVTEQTIEITRSVRPAEGPADGNGS